MSYSFEGNRVIRDTGSEFPIFQAPIGRLAQSQWTGAISAAGGMGLMETSTQGSAGLTEQSDIIRSRTNRPFGYHLLANYLDKNEAHEKDVMDWLLAGRPNFVTIGLGRLWSQDLDPWRHVKPLQDAGAKCYYVVETMEELMRSEDAGVDGLILAGAEAGGIRGDHDLHIFSLLQKVRHRVDLPLVASGGIVDGYGMAGAFALGAEGVLMGTRFMASPECPIHENYKQSIVDADGVMYVNFGVPDNSMIAVRNSFSEAVARGDIDAKGNPYAGPPLKVYVEGKTDEAMVGVGESALLFDTIKPVADIMKDTVSEFWSELDRLAGLRRPVLADV